MNRHARHLARHASILGASTLALTAATARADITVQYDSWLLPFSYEATSVPDFDQRRTGLGNNGSMYCVPTSAMDWLAYITNHGAPEVMGGVENWQSQAVYGQVTGQLAGLGFFMGTEPGSNGGGTGLDGGRHGIATWLNNTTSKPFIVTSQARDIEWAPKLAYLVANAKNQGLVMPMVGWYEQSGSVIDRDGGHCIAMTRATQSAQLQKSIGFHDPASDESPNDLGMQSPFSQSVNTVVDTQVIEFFIPHYRSKVVGMTSGGKQGYVDGMITIRPLWILAPDPTVNAVIGLFSFTLDGNEPPAITRTFMPEGSVLRDIAIHSDAMQIASIIDPADGPPEVRLSTPGTDEVMRITGMEDPRRLVIGARRGLYLLDANDLVLFDMDGEDGPQEIKRLPLPAYAQTLAYDDKKHEVVALSAEERVLMAVPHDLGQEPEMRFIPDEVMLQMESEIAWDPSTEGWWIATPGSDVLSHMRWTDDAGLIVTMQVELPGFSAPSSFDVGDDGRLYVMAENGLNELAPTETGDYELAAEPHFPDFELPGPIRVAKSRTNYDPDLHDGPAWRNELPDPDAPECIGDADGNGDVGFSDLSALLAAWGACPAAPAPCPMDLDQDGDVDFGDLTALLGAWGACP